MIEVVQGPIRKSRNRYHFFSKDDYKALTEKIKPETEMYRSTWIYPDNVQTYVHTKGSLAGFRGLRKIDWVILDLDPTNLSFDMFQLTVQHFLEKLIKQTGETGIGVFFSGRGYHFAIHEKAWNFKESYQLPNIIRETLREQFKDEIESGLLDLSIYNATGIYRVVNSINPKTNLYKIQLRPADILDSDYADIQAMAKEQCKLLPVKIIANIFSEYRYSKKKQQSFTQTGNPVRIATCIHKLVEIGPVNGTRHQAVLRIASHLKRRGVPIDLAYRGLLSWVNDSEGKREWEKIIGQSYRVGYNFGCNDFLLRRHCNPHCIFYKNKNYGDLEVISSEGMIQQFPKKLLKTTMYSYPLGNYFGLDPKIETDISPGELVTLIGPTKIGKTAFLQNLAVGWDPVRKKLNPDYILNPTLFVSLELGATLLYRRFLQIVTGLSKEEIIRRVQANQSIDFNESTMEHIHYIVDSLDLEKLEAKIVELQPKLVIIDHVGFISATKATELLQVNSVYRKLVELKRRYPIIFFVVSHISREEAKRIDREQKEITLQGGIYSSTIEQSSDKIIGMGVLGGRKYVKCLANRDGHIWSKRFYSYNQTFRMEMTK